MSKPGQQQFEEGEQRRVRWLESYAEKGDLKTAHRDAGVSESAYRQWRQRFPDFRVAVDALKMEWKDKGHVDQLRGSEIFTEDNWRKASFAVFRKHYYGFDTPEYQTEIVKSYEFTDPGNITMILIPPEHGKTTLFEDYATWKLALEPGHRFTVGSESQTMARKILGRVKHRLDPAGPFPKFVKEWGPFIPQKRGRGQTTHSQQPWGADWFNVFKKQDQDERDYNMVALGINAQIAGTRTDHLHIDDVMSMNNVSQTKQIVQKMRQDWFSRPGQRGRTTIAGTRVDIGDVYEVLEQELSERLLTVIRMPAIVDRGNGPEPLWPYDEETDSGWTMEMLDRQREMVGEEAWARNYMQKPIAAGEATFTEEAIGRCLNPMRSHMHDAKPENGPIVITCDPSIGGRSAFAVLQFSDEKLRVLETRAVNGLSTNQQIVRVIAELGANWTMTGCVWTDVIVESMSFQKGLVEEESLIALRDKHGFRIRGHLTNNNKYDENIGVPSMATSFVKGDVDIPYAQDDVTRYHSDDLKRELLSWRPKVRGSKLRQDRVMALWFGWIEWRNRCRTGLMDLGTTQTVKTEGLSWTPTTGVLRRGGRYDAA